MSPPNGHAKDSVAAEAPNRSPEIHAVHLPPEFSCSLRLSQQEIKDFCTALEIPFDPGVIDWRVTNTSRNGKLRGQVIPYADQRAYTDRLNQLFTPAGWTRKYQVHTSSNFERRKDQKTVAKVFVTCELSISGLGTHSATGEEWSDDENAVTSAEAQAFKRSCACFGLGRYLYHFEGVWIDLNDRKRPKQVPRLPVWATPNGWLKGLRPNAPTAIAASVSNADDKTTTEVNAVVQQIESMAKPLGRGLYRGLLRAARVWSPNQIADPTVQRKLLEQMQSAQRGLERLRVAIEKASPGPLNDILRSQNVRSLDAIDSLKMLKQVVLAIEAVVSSTR